MCFFTTQNIDSIHKYYSCGEGALPAVSYLDPRIHNTGPDYNYGLYAKVPLYALKKNMNMRDF